MRGRKARLTEDTKAEIAKRYDGGADTRRLCSEYHIGYERLKDVLQEKSDMYEYAPQKRMKKCRYCGKYAPHDAAFCPYCGKDIHSEWETTSRELLAIRATVVKYLPEGVKHDIDIKLLDLRKWAKSKEKENE